MAASYKYPLYKFFNLSEYRMKVKLSKIIINSLIVSVYIKQLKNIYNNCYKIYIYQNNEHNGLK